MAEWMNRKSFLLVMSFILTIFLFALATDANGGLRSSSLNPQSSSIRFRMYRFTWISTVMNMLSQDYQILLHYDLKALVAYF